LIEPGKNVGFARGNNLGIQAASGRHLLFLNPDTEIIGDALSRLTAYLDQNPQVGVVGPQLLNPDGSIQSSRRRFPTFWTAVFESTWLEPIAPRRVLDRYFVRDIPDDTVCEVDWVQGAAFAVRREVVEQVGAFDESFFMYSEELDWQKRIKQAGWRIVSLPAAQVIHHGGRSSDQVVARRHIYFQTSKVHYFSKHHGPLLGSLVRLVLLANYLWQTMLEAVKWVLGHKRPLRRERVRAYWQVLRSGLRG
jgi:GT2 family glycosyltransferase